ncbi:hypothetical protein [Pseudohaliea rubra]|uniref:Uncharacterized protein n=1 Tax=Pseudohaliea rubra DSM 19751 TaxID=1265313 RepID=A0A095VQM0_9GAMM|nr:hypothetical protein [Pseudohaliea rubra]KGE03757.1 hypothetical protein HRUBRA_01648 [Pseudohaliea rubra DSM 19751]
MLTSGSYMLAMATYLGAGIVALALLARWLRRWPLLASWLSCSGAALLLLPAFPEPGLETLAPALVVAAFQAGTAGVDAAMHALRPLGLALLLAQVPGLAIGLWLRHRRAVATASP